MQALRLTALMLALVSTVLEARDRVPREAKSSLSALDYNAIDNTIMSDSQQYAPNLVGLRQYLNQEVAQGSRDYERLNSRLQELEKQDQFAFRASMVPFGLGAGSLLIGSLLYQDEEPTDPRLKSIHERGGRLMLYGLGGLVAGFILSDMLAPDENDLREFIQFHNSGATRAATQQGKSSNLSFHLLTGDSVLALSYKF